MNYSPIIDELWRFWWVIPSMLVVATLKTAWFKGLVGEALVRFVAWVRLPKSVYHRLHNVTLRTHDGTTQIDHVFISCFGVFVVETKNMKGWIFGSERQAFWTQKMFKKSFRFQNPLRQNYKHVKALEETLAVPPKSIHSVVAFVGGSKFKSPMPTNVTRRGGYISYIKSFSEPVLSETQVKSALDKLMSSRLEPNRKTQRQHVRQLKKRSTKQD